MASESEAEDLERAVALSPTESSGRGDTVTTEQTNAPVAKYEPEYKSDTQGTGITGLLGLDRKGMEVERMARQASRALNRKRSISPPALGSRKARKIYPSTVTLPSGAKLRSFSSLVAVDQSTRKSPAAGAATKALSNGEVKVKAEDVTTNPSDSLQFPHGAIRKTWCFGHERRDNDIKLEEVLEPLTLRTAVLSAFQWDTEWILSKLRITPKGAPIKCVFVMQAKEPSLRQKLLSEAEGMRPFLRLCFPPMEGQVHCMHSKLMLLFHKDKLRIAVPSANLVPPDWGEHGTMENSVFIVDLPRLSNGEKTSLNDLTPFGRELVFFLRQQGLDDAVTNGVLNFNFSATKPYAFVHTIGGTLFGAEAETSGLVGLANSVREFGLSAREDLQIDFAASSIGSLDDGFLSAVHAAARGEDMIQRQVTAASEKNKDFFAPKLPTKGSGNSVRDRIRIYFPTDETVTSSKAGATGTICVQRKWFERKGFPRDVFRDYISVRPGVLSHNKILYARGRAPDGRAVAWTYVGSANMSESAWGRLSYDKVKKEWKNSARNWECGVLVPVPAERLARMSSRTGPQMKRDVVLDGEDAETESEDERVDEDVVGMDVFKDVMDAPFEYPGREYGNRGPWYFMD